MMDQIIFLHIHICRQEASFQRPENVWSSGSGRRDKELRNCVGADQCEIIGRRRHNGSDAYDPDGQSMKVHKCDGHGKVDCVLVKLMFKRDVETSSGKQACDFRFTEGYATKFNSACSFDMSGIAFLS